MCACISMERARRSGSSVWWYGGVVFWCLGVTLGVQAAVDGRAHADAKAAVVVFEDDFESGIIHDWDFFGQGSTAETGEWEIGDPNGTVDSVGSQAQPEDAYGGVGCVFTAQNTSLGSHDVDFGISYLVSPWIDLRGYRSAELRYVRWFYGALPNVDTGDYFIVAVRSSAAGPWVKLEKIGYIAGETNTWTPRVFHLEEYIELTGSVQVRFGANDGSVLNTVVEAALDDVSIHGTVGCTEDEDCAAGEYCDGDGVCVRYGDGDFDGDGDVDLADFTQFQGCFLGAGLGPCAPGNLAGDASVDMTDYAAWAEIMNGPQ